MAKEETKKAPNVSQAEGIIGALEVALDDIIADDKFNARKNYEGKDAEKGDSRQSIEHLAESIKRDGLHQPVLVRRNKSGKYSLVYGFRRYRAMLHLHEKSPKNPEFMRIRAQLWEGDDKDAYLVNLTENCARNDLLPWELAERCAWLAEEYKMVGQEIGQRVGKSKGYVDNLIRIASKVHPDILKEWRKGNTGLTTDKLTKWAALPHAEQLTTWKATNANANGANGANGATGTTPAEGAGTGSQAGELKKPNAATIKKMLAALDSARKAKKIDKERYNGMVAMYRFLMAKRADIPGVYSPQKEASKPKEREEAPDVLEID